MNKNLKIVLGTIIGIIILWVLVTIISSSNDSSSKDPNGNSNGIVTYEIVEGASVNSVDSSSDWRDFDLVNVIDGSTFSVSSLSDRPVLLESFAVWCPKCTSQQKEVAKLHDDLVFGDSFYSVSLNTDPNEDFVTVKDHVLSNSFSGRYAVASNDFTNSLIDEFGVKIVSAPSVPMILICNGNSYFLDSGVKKVDELKEELSAKCGV